MEGKARIIYMALSEAAVIGKIGKISIIPVQSLTMCVCDSVP